MIDLFKHYPDRYALFALATGLVPNVARVAGNVGWIDTDCAFDLLLLALLWRRFPPPPEHINAVTNAYWDSMWDRAPLIMRLLDAVTEFLDAPAAAALCVHLIDRPDGDLAGLANSA